MRLQYASDNDHTFFVRLSQRIFGQAYAYQFEVQRAIYESPDGRRYLAYEILHGRRVVRVVMARTLRRWQRAQLRSA